MGSHEFRKDVTWGQNTYAFTGASFLKVENSQGAWQVRGAERGFLSRQLEQQLQGVNSRQALTGSPSVY